MHRRKYLWSLTALILALAGCTDQDTAADATAQSGTTEVPDTETETTDKTSSSNGGSEETTVLYHGDPRLKVEELSSTPSGDVEQMSYENLTKGQKDVFDAAVSTASAPYNGEFDFGNRAKVYVKRNETVYELSRVSA